MNNRYCFEALDKSLRDILAQTNSSNHNQPFGGKSILLGGDFRQILPVIPGGTKEDIINASLSSSPIWPKFKIMLLKQNMRLSIDAMVSAIYPNIELPTLEPSYFKERAIVTPKNITATEINNFILGVTHGTQRIYLSNASFINQLEFSGVPSHILALKIGAPIMLLRNLSPLIGLCNGTQLIITQLADKLQSNAARCPQTSTICESSHWINK
ncbi:ATP-dependent DNA helicase [Salix suchowensis]|nr:ATP-dependent DNA helicase [Salix suchowensis]